MTIKPVKEFNTFLEVFKGRNEGSQSIKEVKETYLLLLAGGCLLITPFFLGEKTFGILKQILLVIRGPLVSRGIDNVN